MNLHEHNLFVAYDLVNPGQNYEAVQARIKSLGRWHKAQYSLFYVHAQMSPDAAYNHVSRVMDANDRLAVIAATRAVISDPPEVVNAINAVWFSNAA